MYLSTAGGDGRVLAWLVDETLDLPVPPGLEWMTPEQLDGYYLLYQPDADAPNSSNSMPGVDH